VESKRASEASRVQQSHSRELAEPFGLYTGSSTLSDGVNDAVYKRHERMRLPYLIVQGQWIEACHGIAYLDAFDVRDGAPAAQK
jgi:hypothetical protein